jgi:hypothetical protein
MSVRRMPPATAVQIQQPLARSRLSASVQEKDAIEDLGQP